MLYTMPRSKSAAVRPPLADLENVVMQAVWNLGPCPVEALHQEVAKQRPVKEVTVRTILRRLEEKGYLKHDVEGRAFLYRAVEPPQSLAARAVRQIIDRFCNGSVEQLVTGMVSAKVLSRAELADLEKLVRKHNQGSN
jgi:BlaI family transcriptional regulator, penicillinase repressor